jgi:AraC family transcriptional regulator, transcriptional activator of pobA
MQINASFIQQYTQNEKLAIRLISPTFGRVPLEVFNDFGLTHRKTFYFFIFMIEGVTQHGVDLQDFSIEPGEMLEGVTITVSFS